MTSINNTSGQDLFIAALKQPNPEQKKQICRQLKEMFPDHPMVAKIAKVSHLLNWSTVEWMIAHSQIKYLEGLPTPETAMTELLWNSYMGGKEIEQGNLLLFQILDTCSQYKLKSKLANHLIEKNDTLGLSAASLTFMQARELHMSNPGQALALYDQVIHDADSAVALIALAKLQKALLLQNGGEEIPMDLPAALDLYNQVINEKHAPPNFIATAKYNKALILQCGWQGVQIDKAAALDLYTEVINNKDLQPNLIAQAKFQKALMHQNGGPGVQVSKATALDLHTQVINDEHTPPNVIAKAKYMKALLLHYGGQGLPIDFAAAIDLYNQVINDKHTLLAIIAAAKYEQVLALKCNNASPNMVLKAAYAARNTPKWPNVLTYLHGCYGGENFSSLTLTTYEERFYLMLLLEEPKDTINHLKETGRPPQRFGGGMKSFLTYLLTSDLPDFSGFQTQVLEAIRENYPSLLKKIDLNLLARETLSKICYEAAQEHAREGNHELSDWFYEQIPFGSSKYADGLEGVFMLHSNLALAENPSFIHRYQAIKFIKMKIAKYSHHLRTKQNALQNQKDTVHTLIRQIDEIKEKAKEELKTRAPTPSLMTRPILQLIEVKDAIISTSSTRARNDAELDVHLQPNFTKAEEDSIR